jgi:predicted AlkP superfamily pyrophosphatase or phosphodiesterase
MMIYGTFAGVNFGDTVSSYEENVMQVEFYENTLETAIPQTDLYEIIESHFEGELPEGKTEKKAIVLGYDGCRADALTLVEEEGAIFKLITEGGKAYIAYCGGVNYPQFNTQDTSTAPGWASILTGKWADDHGITGNSIVKSLDHLTLLTTLVEDGKVDDSAFYVSWNGHFVGDDSTYKAEKAYCEEKGLDVIFSDADDDNGTQANTLKDVMSADCSDFIFTIYEHTDHEGHSTGFSINNPDYQRGFSEEEAFARQVIEEIENRATYETEDWLIVITSDHGGYNTGHGAFTIQERMTFYVVK